ncbi:hypothetical protein [Desulfospira joergensenii]|uniref:hypothetical protein n=1 Tax=Desulfospira joergensenii TaxID=53329 RepID=UPI0003B7138F|nr:hypothetical protein [Desulfospira joergensenii]
MSKIFVRERRKMEKGEKKPRLRVVGISGKEVKIYTDHIRKIELEAIAKETGAQIIYLPVHGTGNRDGSGK